MPLRHSQLIEVRRSPRRGRGVFARRPIREGSVIERVPVITLSVAEVFSWMPRLKLADYVFRWDEETVAIALGYGSLYNHSYRPNARFRADGPSSQVFSAVRDIDEGEEITINYSGPAGPANPPDFAVVGD